MAQLRGLPGVTAVLGQMTWTLERERPGPRVHDAPKELLTVMGVEGDPNDIPGALRLDQGRWPRRTDEIMVGAKLAREKPLSVGETVCARPAATSPSSGSGGCAASGSPGTRSATSSSSRSGSAPRSATSST